MIDLDRISLILINNRINEPIKDYANDFRANSLTEDPTSAVYLSKIVELAKSADSLKVYFDAFKHPSSDIRVGYRLFRVDAPQEPLWELFPGFENLDVMVRLLTRVIMMDIQILEYHHRRLLMTLVLTSSLLNTYLSLKDSNLRFG